MDLAADADDITDRGQNSIPTVKSHLSELTHSVSSFLPAYIQCSQGRSDIRPVGNHINHEHDCGTSEDASDEVVLPASSEEMARHSSETVSF